MEALDIASLRISLVVVVLAAFVLFYVVTYRVTRAAYAALWSLALLQIVLGTTLMLGVGTSAQALVLPPANGLLLGGAIALYAGVRTVDGLAVSRALVVPPVLVALVTAADDPGTKAWAGDLVYLPLLGLATGATALHLWTTTGPRLGLRRALAGAIAVESAFYLVRTVAFFTMGPQDARYDALFGPVPATLVNLAVLMGGVLGMTALSTEQQVRELRSQATRDGLTQLLNRAEFDRRATVAIERMRRGGMRGTLVIADLDHFKTVNDTWGHEVGDRVLCAFAEACRSVVRASDLVARVGGEEFVLLLPGSSPQDAERVVRELRALLCAVPMPDPDLQVTASYGVVSTTDHRGLAAVVAAADAALYRAKRAGRDRLGHADSADRTPGELVELG
ncbi:GGDEF domain-containing protein [Aeromicrobium sp. IC_218]|uniref:GGDEF domain-containing protein n=1 Tax=Aeromicrobium sp. IC_218 TaxID=2545468 RepID=UPI0010396368|nr:GGDEF domain-containing protein [Aeromicrobium sp. IC_218]TCJ00035.1 GGDEF domain-containing protein [Aeromicrobium sp. IC_218]